MGKRILVINPGSTSTKVSLFFGREVQQATTISHEASDLATFPNIADQFEYRQAAVKAWMQDISLQADQLDAVVGRGGILRPIPSGTYLVTDYMLEDLKDLSRGEHASNLGAMIAQAIAADADLPAYIVDPVAVDEFHPVARISGLKGIPRRSLGHMLNLRATSLRYAKEQETALDQLNLIVAHIGGGVSVAAMQQGKIIDINNGNEMGPFSPERTGGLPVWSLAQMIYQGRFNDFNECKNFLRGQGGVVAYLGTSDMRKVEQMIEAGDEQALLVSRALAYQVAKEIGMTAAVLAGDVDAILITGGVAHSKRVTNEIKSMVEWIAPVQVYAGEDEMEALALGALRVLNGEEVAKDYHKEVEA